MALVNGVLIPHGAEHPGLALCATPDGGVKVVAERKRVIGSSLRAPLAPRPRPPGRWRVPAAREARGARGCFPSRAGACSNGVAATAAATQVVRRARLRASAKELVTTIARAGPGGAVAAQGALAAYHGAESLAIGSYEHGEPRSHASTSAAARAWSARCSSPAAVPPTSSPRRAPLRCARRRGPSRRPSSASQRLDPRISVGWMQRNPVPARPCARKARPRDPARWPAAEAQRPSGSRSPRRPCRLPGAGNGGAHEHRLLRLRLVDVQLGGGGFRCCSSS